MLHLVEVAELRQEGLLPHLGLVLEALLERLLVEASSPVMTAVLVVPTLLVGASLVAVAVKVVVEVVVLATAELLGVVGDHRSGSTRGSSSTACCGRHTGTY